MIRSDNILHLLTKMLPFEVFHTSSVILLLILSVQFSDAWWGGRSDSKSSSSDDGQSRGFWDGVKDSMSKAGDFVSGAAKGTGAMLDAYTDMRQANFKNSDKYFHARGNFDAAQHGPGGMWAAEKISNAREWVDRNIKGDSPAASAADQEANQLGRSGGDPNKYRPAGLPPEYKKKRSIET